MNGKRFHLTVVPSTNSYTTELIGHNDIDEWSIVTTDFQSAGRGQRTKVWESDFGQNLLSSLVNYPSIAADNQFLLLARSALALVDLLESYGLSAQIKWPNDILINGKKIAGLLIENQIRGQKVMVSIIGLGLNVNQKVFSAFDWPATSMANELGQLQKVDELAKRWVRHCSEYGKSSIASSILLNQFNDRLFGKDTEVYFQEGDQQKIAILKEVAHDGAIILDDGSGEKKYYNGEIKIKRTSSKS